MVEFIFVTILMVSFSCVLYLMVRALPRIVEEPEERRGLLDRWAHSEIPEKIDLALNDFLFKFLRKIKVAVLKLDNLLGNHLQKIKAKEAEQEKKATIDFREINELGEGSAANDRRKFGRRETDRQEEENSL